MSGKSQNTATGRKRAAPSMAYRRVRLVLDCILILLILWVASGNWLAARAEPARQAEPVGQSEPINQAGDPGTAPADAARQPSSAQVDNNTLAAVIAAENAALTPPIYFTDMPLISH